MSFSQQAYSFRNEGNMNRMLQCDCALINASRSDLSQNHGPEENHKKNKLMVAELLLLGYGVAKIKGVSPEGMTDKTAEDCYLVVNRDHDENFVNNLSRISDYYHQDSIYHKEAPGFWRDMIVGRMLIKEDIHPLTRKTMGEELRKMKKNKEQ